MVFNPSLRDTAQTATCLAGARALTAHKIAQLYPTFLFPATRVVSGPTTCLSFIILAYSLCLIAFMTGFSLRTTIRCRQERKYNHLTLTTETNSETPLSPRPRSRDLVGASFLARYLGKQSSPSTAGPPVAVLRSWTLLTASSLD